MTEENQAVVPRSTCATRRRGKVQHAGRDSTFVLALAGATFLVALAVSALATSGAGCGWDVNERFCCVTAEVCMAGGAPGGRPVPCTDPARPVCDEDKRECVPDTTMRECEGPSDCTDADLPVCVDGECRECDGTTGCEANAPVCDVEDTYTCVGCGVDGDCAAYPGSPRCEEASGACVGCLDAVDDCLDAEHPVCGSDHQCRGCEGDGECGSGICDELSGRCVPESEIIYVAVTGSGNECTRPLPCATISDGVEAVTAKRRNVLVAAGSYTETVTVDDTSLTLVATGASLQPAELGQAALVVLNGSQLEVEGLEIHEAGGGANGDGIRCAVTTSGSPSVLARQVTIRGCSGQGLEAASCTVTIERSTISGNSGGGVSVIDGQVTIVNNMIVRNGGLSSTIGGIKLDSITDLSFDFNTVADNATLDDGFAPGVQCSATTPVLLGNSIIHGDAATQVSTTQCSFSYTLSNQEIPGSGNLTDDPRFVDPAMGDYHLGDNSPAIEGADPAASLAIDFDGDSRPQGEGRDIGADERVR